VHLISLSKMKLIEKNFKRVGMLGPDIIYRLNEDLTVLDMNQILENQEKAENWDRTKDVIEDIENRIKNYEIVERLKKRIEDFKITHPDHSPDECNFCLTRDELQKILGEEK